jgi:H+/Cl- antiporter ClcA
MAMKGTAVAAFTRHQVGTEEWFGAVGAKASSSPSATGLRSRILAVGLAGNPGESTGPPPFQRQDHHGWLAGEGFVEAVETGDEPARVANFALIEVFPQWESGVGLAWVLVSFAALCVVAVIFVRTRLPETKGHSLDEIIRLFERHAAAGTDAGPAA